MHKIIKLILIPMMIFVFSILSCEKDKTEQIIVNKKPDSRQELELDSGYLKLKDELNKVEYNTKAKIRKKIVEYYAKSENMSQYSINTVDKSNLLSQVWEKNPGLPARRFS
jgi:hypothetical protein